MLHSDQTETRERRTLVQRIELIKPNAFVSDRQHDTGLDGRDAQSDLGRRCVFDGVVYEFLSNPEYIDFKTIGYITLGNAKIDGDDRTVTDAVSEEVKLWQGRALNALYPIVYLDCIHVKVRDSGAVRTKAVYLAIGVNMDGHKEVLGLWIAQTEGAKFWLQVVTELKTRGVQDIFIACVDGLKGFPEAIEAVYPKAAVQLCIVHMVRNSLNFVSWKLQREVAADLRTIYGSVALRRQR